MVKKKMVCCGSFNKKEDCGREFFYALREDVDGNHNSVTVVYAVDRSGCPITNGNLIVLQHHEDRDVLFCDNINESLGLSIEGGTLVHDEACIADNDYLG
jgi:hypothetical protein